MTVTNGDTINLACEASGYPPPIVSWRKDLQPLPSNSRYHLVSRVGIGTLTVENAQTGDSGMYNCELKSRLYGTILSRTSTQVTVNDGKTCLTKE